MIEINSKKYFTPKEVAIKFGVHISSVARWRQNGWIKSEKTNQRKHLYEESEIENFIKRGSK